MVSLTGCCELLFIVSLRSVKNYGLVILNELLEVYGLYQLSWSCYEYHVSQNYLNIFRKVHTTTAVCHRLASDISGSSSQV